MYDTPKGLTDDGAKPLFFCIAKRNTYTGWIRFGHGPSGAVDINLDVDIFAVGLQVVPQVRLDLSGSVLDKSCLIGYRATNWEALYFEDWE